MLTKLSRILKDVNLGLLFIRVGLAAVFIYHGLAKFQNMDGTVAFFATLGLSVFFAYLVAFAETVSGLAMLLGVGVEYAGIVQAIIMLVAILLVKWPTGFAGGYEFDLMLLLTALGVAAAGSGRYTVMGLWKKAESTNTPPGDMA